MADSSSNPPSNVRPWEGSFAYEPQPSTTTDSSERPNRSVNDFQCTGDLRQALVSSLKGSRHAVEPAQLFSDQAVLQDLMSAYHDAVDPAVELERADVKDVDQNLDWVLENFDEQLTDKQSLEHEQRKLLVLKSYLVLDTKRQISFEQITSLASKRFNCPIALISLVDLCRQWFLSNRGLGEVRETPRKLAFCAHTIMSKEDCLVVPDATKDFRFKDHPFVTGPPDIRFYAGAPLVSPEGYTLGTLCLVDTKARPFNLEQSKILKDLAAMAVRTLVDHRRMMSVWFNNLVKTHYPEFEAPDAELTDLSNDKSLYSHDEERDPRDHDVAVFLEITKRMSLRSLLFLLQSQARAQNLSPEYMKQYAALAETVEASTKPKPLVKRKKLRFAECGANHEVQAKVHNVDSWKHIKELWWSPEEIQAIRMEALGTVELYRECRPQFTRSVEIIAKSTEPQAVVEDHMRQLTEQWNVRGLESHIVGLLSSRRSATTKAVIQEQAECQESDDWEITTHCLREQSLVYSQLSTRFAEKMGQCDQISALKASMSQWRASPPHRGGADFWN